MLHIENGLNDIAEDQGLPDNYLVGIDDLHALSPDDLRDILVDVYARPVTAWAVKEIGFARVKEFQAWIDREWAAVSRATNGADSEGDSTPEQSEIVDASGEVTNPLRETPQPTFPQLQCVKNTSPPVLLFHTGNSKRFFATIQRLGGGVRFHNG